MSTELTRPENSAVARSGGADFSGFGAQELGANDIELPRLRLLQPLSQAVTDRKGGAGEWFNNLTEESYGSTIIFTPITNFKNRIRLVQGEGLKCRSLDMVHGQGDPGILCEECKYKDWPKDRIERGDNDVLNLAAPECGESMNYLGIVVAGSGDGTLRYLESPDLAVLQWRSTSLKAARKLNGLFMNASGMSDKGLQWWELQYRIGVERQKNDKGSFYSPAVTPGGKTSAEHIKVALNLTKFLTGKALSYEAQEEDLEGVPTRGNVIDVAPASGAVKGVEEAPAAAKSKAAPVVAAPAGRAPAPAAARSKGTHAAADADPVAAGSATSSPGDDLF